MTGTILDLVEGDLPEGKEGFMELAARAPQPKDKSFINDIKDYGKTILKGSIEGFSKLGTMMGPTGSSIKHAPEEHEKQTQTLNELLPTDEGFGQRGIRRALNMAPSATATPFGGPLQSLVRSTIAGYTGEGAKELGAPEWLQTASELTAFLGPDVTKKLLAKGSKKEIIEAARKMGMSDEAITPLLQSDVKQKWLSKLTPRRGRTQEALGKTKSELGEVYTSLENSPVAKAEITEKQNGKLINNLYEQLDKLPRELRNKIDPDLHDLLNNKINGKSLINFYKDVNSTLKGNSKQISLIKDPIKNALKEISPDLAKDFDIVNDLFSKYYKINARLQPNLMTDIIGASEAIGTLFSVATGNYPYIAKIAGEHTARQVARELLINPRFQQISNKLVDAVKQNNFIMIKKLSDLFAFELKKKSPELSKKLENLSEKELIELLMNQE